MNMFSLHIFQNVQIMSNLNKSATNINLINFKIITKAKIVFKGYSSLLMILKMFYYEINQH